MARLDRPVASNTERITNKYYEWKSNDKGFEYYDRDTQSKVEVKLPLKLLFLEHYTTVKGWSDSANSGIWSNEVYATGSEKLVVRNSKGVIAEGLYADIKEKIKMAGGKYVKSIYCMTEDGEIINLQLKGSAIGGINADKSKDKKDCLGWSSFYGGDKKKNIKGVSHLLDNQWFEIKDVCTGKSGAVTYHIPKFEIGEVISREVDELANDAAKRLQEYMNAYFGKDAAEATKDAETESQEEEDDLPF